MPYLLAINFPYIVGSGNENVCGENAVNAGKAGLLDGYSVALGHEIEETVTDPGGEATTNNPNGTHTVYGGWYDATDPNENGDKCAWVGEPANNSAGVQNLPGEPSLLPVYGAMGDIKGNAGGTFAVQSLWSNADGGGIGYCAGAGTDSPIPPAAYGSGSASGSRGSGAGSGSGSSSTTRGVSTTRHTKAARTKRPARHKAKHHRHSRRHSHRRTTRRR
jgi:hypothetical protein